MSETNYYSETPKRLILHDDHDIPRVKRRLKLSSLNVRPYPTKKEWEETCISPVVPKVSDIIQHFESLVKEGRLGMRTIIVGADENTDAYWKQVSDIKAPEEVSPSAPSSNGVFRNDSRSSGIVSDFEEEDSSIPENQITKEEDVVDVEVEPPSKEEAKDADAINYKEIPRSPPPQSVLLSPPTPFKDSKKSSLSPPAAVDVAQQQCENDELASTVVSRLKVFLIGGGLLAMYILLLGKSPFSSSRGSFWFSFGAVILNAFLYYHFVLRRNSGERGGVIMEDAQGSSSSKIKDCLVYFLHPAYFLRCGDEVTLPYLGTSGLSLFSSNSLSDSGFLDDEIEDVAHRPEGHTAHQLTTPTPSRLVKEERKSNLKFSFAGFLLPVLYVLTTTLEFVWAGVLPLTAVIPQLPALFLVFHMLPQFLSYFILLHLE